MAEALRMVHTCGRVLLRWWRWPVNPKLVFDQMAAPVPEIMDTSGRYLICLLHIRHLWRVVKVKISL
jgi:hypothetical protein